MKARHHLTKNTQAATYWCNRCSTQTLHRVDDGRKGPCIPCMKRAARAAQTGPAHLQLFEVESKQGELF